MSFDTSQDSYIALRNIIAERTDGIVFWTGSGLSAEAGLPTWGGLKKALLATLHEQIERTDDSKNKEQEKRAAIQIEREQNSWRAFEQLKKHLGPTTWRSRIREIIGSSQSISPPVIYKKIWELRPHGLLTLNLDRLATKAHQSIDHTAAPLTEFVGNAVAQYSHVLKSPHSFLCHLHGLIEDQSSWVLTSSELRQQRTTPGYQNFIRTCLSAKTMVFVGISVDDTAVGGFLEDLSSLRIDVGEHYWFTHRRDQETVKWAERRGVRLISYQAPDGNHGELLEAMDDLLKFISTDDPADLVPIIPSSPNSTGETLPTQEVLLKLDAESIREALNREASRILASSASDANENYVAFSKNYDEAIYRAWYTGVESKSPTLLGHTLHSEVASGAFGKVYRASDAEGNDVAVKVLHHEMRRNEDLFQAFRRGVRSMKILGDNNVEGMVPYRKAFEIPAFVVMDWIDGPALGEAVAAKQIDDWGLILKIGSAVADIVRNGHALHERVLHRDIRPSNIMLRGFYSNPDDWDVVVLDFDLSWHRGALERSVTHGSTLLGYLAPEQIQDIPGVSTRHAAVDSFGLGMVLFFMLSERDPVPDQHRHVDWKDALQAAAARRPCVQWVSTPARFARLINSATLNSQAERWDMTQIQAELRRLREAVLDPSSPVSAELIAEELAARCDFSKNYYWNENLLAAEKEESSGVKFAIQGDESLRRVVVSISWGLRGVQGKRHLGKWINPAMEDAKNILVRAGWQVEEVESVYASIFIKATLPSGRALRDMVSTVKSLDRALDKVRFS